MRVPASVTMSGFPEGAGYNSAAASQEQKDKSARDPNQGGMPMDPMQMPGMPLAPPMGSDARGMPPQQGGVNGGGFAAPPPGGGSQARPEF